MLYKSAETSVGIEEGIESIVYEIQNIISQIETVDKDIVSLEKKISTLLKKVSWSPYILSMKGIGEIITAGIIGEIGDFTKFTSEEEILKYAGLNLFECSSGNHKGQRRITKIGRPLLRKLLFFAALNMIREGGIMYDVYKIHCNKGMIKIKAIVAVMRKLLRIMYSLVKKQSFYKKDYLKLQAAA